MPNAVTPSRLVESAAKWRATAVSSRAVCRNHVRAECALVMVSWVVKVLEAMRKSVVSGCTRFNVSARSVPSTLATKCARRSGRAYGVSAVQTMRGPRSDPPMPMFTTSVMRWPVYPCHVPDRTASLNPRMAARTRTTSPITSWPSTSMGRSAGRRSATWSTARFSVVLIFSPRNMAAIFSSSPASRASANRQARVSSTMRCLEKSNRMSSNRRENRSNRPGSCANRSRRCRPATSR